MSWGKGLSVAIILFIGGMLAMVYISFRQTNEMIEDHYYDRELKYEEVIQGKNNLAPYRDQMNIYDSSDVLVLHFPTATTDQVSGSELIFIKPDQQRYDTSFRLISNPLNIPRAALQRGNYILKFSWKNGGVDYFYEQEYSIGSQMKK